MPTISEYYKRVNEAWPDDVPPMTDWEAVRAAAKLWRFVLGVSCPYEIRATSGNRYTWVKGGVLYVNPDREGPNVDRGWRTFVHDLSHYLCNKLYRGTAKLHSREHARLELRIVKEVMKRGWILGSLKTVEKEPPSQAEKRALKLKREQEALGRWEAKARRAETAIRKLKKRIKYREAASS